MDKKKLTERNICTKYILPAVKQAGWDIHAQVREEVALTAEPYYFALMAESVNKFYIHL